MASTREWFETVEEARRRARRRLPRSVYMALVAGAEKGVTLQDNLAAFSELRFAPPRIANLPAARDLATSVLGQADRAAGDRVPDRRAGRAPRGRGGRGPGHGRGRAPRWA